MKTTVMLQARIGSERLPCKVLKHLGPKSIAELAMEALLEIPADDYLLVIDEKSRMALSPLAHQYGFKVFVGPETDVLKRFAMASKAYPSDWIIRATADNPLVSSEAAVEARRLLIEGDGDYAALVGMPLGTGVEVIRREALLKADEEATLPGDREHVCPYLYHHPKRFKIIQKKAPKKWYYPHLSVTIDTIEDFINVESFFLKIYRGKPLPIEAFVPFMPPPPTYLFYPSLREGNGLGHLIRSLRLAEALGHSAFYAEKPLLLAEWVQKTGFAMPQLYLDFHREAIRWIIVDQRECDALPEKLRQLNRSVLALDEGGRLRSSVDYLMDSLPNFLSEKSNQTVSPVFYSEAEKREPQPEVKGCDLLVSFGGEDPEDLIQWFLSALPLTCMVEHSVTVVLGPNYRGVFSSFSNRTHFGKIQWVSAPNSLTHWIRHAKIVVTAFGLTAYEALTQGKTVFLLEPSRYHHQLAKKGHFESYRVAQLPILIKKLQSRLKEAEPLPVGGAVTATQTPTPLFPATVPAEAKAASAPDGEFPPSENLCDFIRSLSPALTTGCPVCGSLQRKSLLRLPYQTFFRCLHCHSLFQKRFDSKTVSYDSAYFFEDYRRQYGRTYLEDFDALYRRGLERCTRIEALYQKRIGADSTIPSRTLLDLGAAYGPFLAAARERGWEVAGVDISPEAVRYLREKGFRALAQSVESCSAESLLELNNGQPWDAVTLWYVIEHFHSLDFFWDLLPKILKPGGILAFSTPSYRGISGRKNLISFLKSVPADHYFILSPDSIRGELKKRGFSSIQVESSGNHPERLSKHLPKSLYSAASKWMQRLQLGDTFECYAVFGEANVR